MSVVTCTRLGQIALVSKDRLRGEHHMFDGLAGQSTTWRYSCVSVLQVLCCCNLHAARTVLLQAPRQVMVVYVKS